MRALYYIPPNRACNERFTGLTIEGLLRLDEPLKEKLSKQKRFGLIYSGYCRYVVNLNSLSETDRLRDFKPAQIAKPDEAGIIDPVFLDSCFRKKNGEWQLTLEGIVVVSKLYLLTRFYPELLDIAFISVLGIPLSLREFFEIASVDKLFRLCRGGYESTPLPVEETCSVGGDASYLFGHTLNGQGGREFVIFVENDDFAAKRAGALYYLLVASVQDKPDLFKDFSKIHIVFKEGSSLNRFSMTLRHDI